MNADLNIDNLSSTELISGMLLFFEPEKFSEQSLYAFLQKLGADFPELAQRLRIVGSGKRRSSEPLRRIFNYLEMGKILEVAMPNPVDQFYRPRKNQRESLRHQLEGRGVLPEQEEALRELAKDFERFVLTRNQAVG